MEQEKNSKVVVLLITLVIALIILCLLFSTGTISFNSKSTTNNQTGEEGNNTTNTDFRNFKCITSIGSQYGYEIDEVNYHFKDNNLNSIDIVGFIEFSGINVTGSEYKDVRYLLENFCRIKDCISVQNNNTLYRSIYIDFSDSDDVKNFSAYKDIEINQILNKTITGNDLSNGNSTCYEVK